MSAIQATENAFGEFAAIADGFGASEGFVGKIEAAQIIAKGVFHAFEGASAQALAATAFANPATFGQGVAYQMAAAAHFAQAAAAPIMARRAATRGGGGGASAAAKTGTTSRGPRAASRGNRDAPQAKGGINFGDIVLADIPALLSRNGQRQLGRQIAADIAREINRSRAMPGGMRL